MTDTYSTQWVPLSKCWTSQWKYDGDQPKQELSLFMTLKDHPKILTLVVKRLVMGLALRHLPACDLGTQGTTLLSLSMLEHLCAIQCHHV